MAVLHHFECTDTKIAKKKFHQNETFFMKKQRRKIFRDVHLFRHYDFRLYDVRFFGHSTFVFSTFFRLRVLTTKNISCSLFLIS